MQLNRFLKYYICYIYIYIVPKITNPTKIIVLSPVGNTSSEPWCQQQRVRSWRMPASGRSSRSPASTSATRPTDRTTHRAAGQPTDRSDNRPMFGLGLGDLEIVGITIVVWIFECRPCIAGTGVLADRILADRLTDRPTETDRQTGRPANRPTNQPTDRQLRPSD